MKWQGWDSRVWIPFLSFPSVVPHSLRERGRAENLPQQTLQSTGQFVHPQRSSWKSSEIVLGFWLTEASRTTHTLEFAAQETLPYPVFMADRNLYCHAILLLLEGSWPYAFHCLGKYPIINQGHWGVYMGTSGTNVDRWYFPVVFWRTYLNV